MPPIAALTWNFSTLFRYLAPVAVASTIRLGASATFRVQCVGFGLVEHLAASSRFHVCSPVQFQPIGTKLVMPQEELTVWLLTKPMLKFRILLVEFAFTTS